MTEASTPEHLWYIVHTYSGHEDRVRENMRPRFEALGQIDRLSDIRIPTEVVTEQKGGRTISQDRKIFPSYVLVKVAMSETVRQLIVNTPKVTGMVGGKRPTPLSQDEVDHMIGAAGGDKSRGVAPVLGSRVRVVGGPFTGHEGQVDHVDEVRGTARVTVTIFDRLTSIDALPFDQIEAIA